MVMKHPPLRSEKCIATTFGNGINISYIYIYINILTHVYCRVSTGFGRILKDIPTNAKSGDGPKISPGFKRQINLRISGYGNFGRRSRIRDRICLFIYCC